MHWCSRCSPNHHQNFGVQLFYSQEVLQLNDMYDKSSDTGTCRYNTYILQL